MEEQIGPGAFFARLEQQAPYWVSVLPQLPRMIQERFDSDRRSEPLLERLEAIEDAHRTSRRLLVALIVVLGLVAAAFLFGLALVMGTLR
jgi:hypothetical protein